MTWDLTYLEVHVRDLGTPSSRTVSIHYSTGGAWADVPLGLVGDYVTHSRYRGQVGSSTAWFAVRYESDAGIWWDNNRGADYRVRPWTPSGGYVPGVVGGGVSLVFASIEPYSAAPSSGWKVNGTMAVDAGVFPSGPAGGGIHINDQTYGPSYWASFYHFTPAYTLTSAPRVGIYNFESDPVHWSGPAYPQASGYSPEVQFLPFAYRYDAAGDQHTYWDNDFDENYRLARAPGTVVQ